MKKTTLILAIASIFALNLNAQTPTFQEFLKQFPAATLPYSFNTQDLQGQIETRTATKGKRLAWEFYEFLPELERSAQFSSMPVHPEPVAAFETETHFALLYNIARGLSRGTKTYSISIFDKAGNYVSTHFVAGVNANTLTAATIDTALNASVKEFKINWTLDYRANGPEGNKVVGLTLLEMQTLELTAPGNPDQIEWASKAAPTQDTTADIAKMK